MSETTHQGAPRRSWLSLGLIAIYLAALLTYNLCSVVVDQNHKAVVLNFGNPVQKIEEPGLYWILPWESVTQIDRRFVLYQSSPKDAITSDKKTLHTSSFALWQIGDPITFIQAVHTAASAVTRIDDTVYSQVRASFGNHSYADIVANDRANIFKAVTAGAKESLKGLGINVAMVLVNRVELPQENKESTFNRMKSERQQMAQGIRSAGDETAQGISSEADKQAAVILAEANKTASVTRGKADAEAAQIYADAYSKNPEFYQLMRGLEAAKTAFGPDSGGNLRLILDGNEAILQSLLK